MVKVEKGQVWGSVNQTEFYVDDIRETEEGRWVHYTNTFTQQTYSCLEPAFRLRFVPVLNKN
jgi:hypothetical protein